MLYMTVATNSNKININDFPQYPNSLKKEFIVTFNKSVKYKIKPNSVQKLIPYLSDSTIIILAKNSQ